MKSPFTELAGDFFVYKGLYFLHDLGFNRLIGEVDFFLQYFDPSIELFQIILHHYHVFGDGEHGVVLFKRPTHPFSVEMLPKAGSTGHFLQVI